MLEEHLSYVGDRARLDLYRAAIARVLKPGDRVADVGCGTGVLGLLCLAAGASRVVAIDSTAMIEVARQSLTRAGFASRVEFIHGLSHRTVLPAPVDVVICDQIGYFGFDYGILRTLQDARRRFLKPGGALIPDRIRLHVGAVESDPCRAKVEGWRADGVPAEFHWLREHAVNARHAVELARDALLGAPAGLADVDLRADSSEFLSWAATLTIARDGVMHGLAGWFEAELAEGVWMSNSPLSDRAIRRPQVFLPIDEAVRVKAGDSVRVRILSRPADELFAWIVELPADGRRFSHSTWRSMPIAREDLLRTRPDRVPRLNRDGEARMAVLRLCDGRRTAGEIEQAVLRDRPERFPSEEEISRFVARVLARDAG